MYVNIQRSHGILEVSSWGILEKRLSHFKKAIKQLCTGFCPSSIMLNMCIRMLFSPYMSTFFLCTGKAWLCRDLKKVTKCSSLQKVKYIPHDPKEFDWSCCHLLLRVGGGSFDFLFATFSLQEQPLSSLAPAQYLIVEHSVAGLQFQFLMILNLCFLAFSSVLPPKTSCIRRLKVFLILCWKLSHSSLWWI